ncbi:PRC-barrel domain-containing protein [Methanothermobacter sp.]|uniref:PRC-barrel domain-containing protein n=1 Tax=Methanothermobacter sp. TaxID=1884223 RepID=UPI002601A572|nr:PRC-barrel domain-containing protein [Methanothermobacter sp.]MDI9618240.1 PRC-barrel domain-containing protein [Methanothermobacter sp.]
MKVTEFLGRKVLDKNAMEIGKVSDLELDPEKGVVDSIIISKGELSLKQRTFIVGMDNVSRVGDYVILKIAADEAEEAPEEESKEVAPE